ncbi:MAG: SDR family NAD(P)-dependent oxidoreductase [Sphingopyxis solisilvae]|uniref:SDR family NAD(P)-dependent oxidoreductase n=1 Tax=Sphingopyxis solisilvae TaxID=1886788 RepID=UPI0040365E96
MSDSGSAVIIGAAGGIGTALGDAIAADGRYRIVHRLARSASPPWQIDLTDEASVAASARHVQAAGVPPRLVIIATGLLHRGDRRPERSPADLDPEWMAENFAINAIGPALVAKHFLPLMPRRGCTVFAALSARVGSIGDNRSGGWHSYRASKAALNQLIRSIAIGETRRNDQAVVVALHPGTVDTRMSAPFQRSVPFGNLVTPAVAAANLLRVIEALTPAQTGRIFAWDGAEITP